MSKIVTVMTRYSVATFAYRAHHLLAAIVEAGSFLLRPSIEGVDPRKAGIFGFSQWSEMKGIDKDVSETGYCTTEYI
jgi:hypothetical protein